MWKASAHSTRVVQTVGQASPEMRANSRPSAAPINNCQAVVTIASPASGRRLIAIEPSAQASAAISGIARPMPAWAWP